MIWLPLLPLIAAALIGVGQLSGVLSGETSENTTFEIAYGLISLSCLQGLILLGSDWLEVNRGFFSIGPWLSSGTLSIRVNFVTSGFNLVLAVLFSVLQAITCRWAFNNLQGRPGFHRCFFILSLLSFSVLLLLVSGNAVLGFIGWESVGWCSYLLLANTHDRPAIGANAGRVFITHRVGDAAFLLGIGLCYAWIDNVNWTVLNTAVQELPSGQVARIALCFAVAAFVKSGQFPFIFRLPRAMKEEPSPVIATLHGAILAHLGVFLIILLQPVFEQTRFPMMLLAIVGFATAFYSVIAGLTQRDKKRSPSSVVSAHLGLMFLECGLGFWQLARWHLCLHVIVRGYLLLTAAPPLFFDLQIQPMKSVACWMKRQHWSYAASRLRFRLDQIADWVLVKPVNRLAQDMCYFDDHVVDRLISAPCSAVRGFSSLFQQSEQMTVAQRANDTSTSGDGVKGPAGKCFERQADITQGLGTHRILRRGTGKYDISFVRRFGRAADRFERRVLKPRYLVLFVLIILMVAF